MLLLSLFCSVPSFAKGITLSIVIAHNDGKKIVEITDADVVKKFQVFADVIADRVAGEVSAPPANLERYRVSFKVENYPQPYVVQYVYDPSEGRGYMYTPGKGDDGYPTNIGMIIHHIEGKWFRTMASWDDVAKAGSLR
jgi:hypothetical protein